MPICMCCCKKGRHNGMDSGLNKNSATMHVMHGTASWGNSKGVTTTSDVCVTDLWSQTSYQIDLGFVYWADFKSKLVGWKNLR